MASHRQAAETSNKQNKKFPAVLIVLLVAVLGAYLIIKSLAATGTATLSLSPSSSTVGVGSNFTVTVYENSGTSQVNTVQASLTYPTSTMQFVSVDYSTSPFDVQAGSSTGSGTISFSRGTTKPGGLMGTISQSSTAVTGEATNFTSAMVNQKLNYSDGTSATITAVTDATHLTVNTSKTVSSSTYSIGTISQSGTAVTGSGTSFSSAMVGATLLYSDGSSAPITAVTDATHLTVATSKSVTAGSSYLLGAISGQQVVAVITFKAVALGASQAVNFGCVYNATSCPTGSVVLNAADGTPLTLTQTNATYNIVDNTAPTVPGTPTVASHAVTSIGLSWTASTDNVGVTGYKIYRNGTQVATTTTTSYTDTGLTPSTSYTYTIAAYDAAGNTSSQSAGVAATTDPDTTAPSVPGAPTQTGRTMTSMALGWTASTDNVGVTGYKVYRNGTQIGTSATNSYTDSSGLVPGTTYTYTVVAYDAVGNTSAQSAGASLATAPDTQAPTTPGNLTVTGTSATSASLSWTASTDNVGVTGYKIYRNGSTTALATVTTTSYTNSGLTSGTAYTYQVSAIDAAGNESAKSTVVTATTPSNGDLNGDGHINIFDLSIFLNHWQQTGTGLAEDFNGDNIVNIFDLSILLNNYGT